MKTLVRTWIFAIIICLLLCKTVFAGTMTYVATENQIHELILKNYNRYVLPRMNRTTPVTVRMGLELRSIDDLDVRSQTITIRAYLGYTWTDVQLTWDPESFDGIQTISVAEEKLWTPSLQFIDSADPYLGMDIDGRLLVVNFQGEVSRWTMEKYKIPCQFRIKNYPFDEQVCPFIFESWHHTSDEVIIIPMAGYTGLANENYQENSEWSIKKTNMTIRVLPFSGQSFDQVEFVIHVKRKYLYHVLYTVVPLACTSLLGITCFILPSANGERVSLSVSLFLALAVIMTIVNNALPETSDEVAYFGVYVSLQLVWSGLTVFMTAVSSSWYFREFSEANVSTLHTVLLFCAGMASKVQVSSEKKKYNTADSKLGEPADIKEENKRYQYKFGADAFKAVSIAIDRICLVTTVVWHIALHVCIIILTLS